MRRRQERASMSAGLSLAASLATIDPMRFVIGHETPPGGSGTSHSARVRASRHAAIHGWAATRRYYPRPPDSLPPVGQPRPRLIERPTPHRERAGTGWFWHVTVPPGAVTDLNP